MTGFLKVVYRLCYRMRSHHWSGWPLDYWLLLLIVLLAGVVSLRWIPGAPGLVYLLALVVVVFWLVTLLAMRHKYVIFALEPDSRAGAMATALLPTDKVELRATGRFEVEGREQHFTEIVAYFRTFATREHTVMAIVPPSRFLLLGSRPDGQEGMWYIFFHPHHITAVEPGILWFGVVDRPALRVSCRTEEGEEMVYLSFDDADSRRRVLADLRHDNPVKGQGRVGK
jgi:hypothetical protein